MGFGLDNLQIIMTLFPLKYLKLKIGSEIYIHLSQTLLLSIWCLKRRLEARNCFMSIGDSKLNYLRNLKKIIKKEKFYDLNVFKKVPLWGILKHTQVL